jgi:hypothetical protein
VCNYLGFINGRDVNTARIRISFLDRQRSPRRSCSAFSKQRLNDCLLGDTAA